MVGRLRRGVADLSPCLRRVSDSCGEAIPRVAYQDGHAPPLLSTEVVRLLEAHRAVLVEARQSHGHVLYRVVEARQERGLVRDLEGVRLKPELLQLLESRDERVSSVGLGDGPV